MHSRHRLIVLTKIGAIQEECLNYSHFSHTTHSIFQLMIKSEKRDVSHFYRSSLSPGDLVKEQDEPGAEDTQLVPYKSTGD